MRFSDNISMAFSDLGRRKKRTFLTSLGVTIGSILILLMVSLGLMIKGFLVDTVNSGSNTKTVSLQAIKAGAVMPDNPQQAVKEMPDWFKKNFKIINSENLEKISKLNDVEGIEAYIGGELAKIKIGDKTYYGNFPIKGYDLKYDIYFDSDVNNAKSSSKDLNFKPIIAGTKLNSSDKDGILVGESLLEKIGVTDPSSIIGKKLTFEIDNINGKPVAPLNKTFTVVGVESKYMPDGSNFVMSAKNAAAIVGFLQYTPDFMKTYGYNGANVEAKSLNDVSKLQKSIEDLGYMTSSNQSKAEAINKNFEDITLTLSILGIIVLLVSAIGIVNTMVMVVSERTKSIGVMKSVGASNSQIRLMFIVQSGVIGFVGGIIGSIISIGLFRIISAVVKESIEKQGQSVNLISNIPWWLVLATIAFSIIISMIAGVYPASKAAKLDPIEALRQ